MCMKGKGRAVEDQYKKLSQLEHILLRPDTYVGSVEKQQAQLWVHDGGEAGLVQRQVTYVPGLYKIFDEIIVNAADNKMRDDSMDGFKVDIDQEAGTIRVWNNGNGLPVEMHKEMGVYVPEMIFGQLLTSSNYNDAEKKVVGGRNGYGAKLANIFSTEFVVETADGSRELRYKQVFSNNMQDKAKPVIKKCKSSENWTCITFTPDLAKFGMERLEDDTVALMRKRVYDVAGCIGARGIKVHLNGARLPIKTFQQYVQEYFKNNPEAPKVFYERCNDRWEVAITASPEGQAQQVSFVNSINTIKGGTHVNAVADKVAAKLLEHITKKNKKANVKAFQIKNHMWVFVNALIENPAFDSQCKETLTSKPSKFGSRPTLSDDLHKKLAKSPIVENVLSWATFKANKDMKKTDGAKKSRLLGVPKLDDANDAGTRNSQKCTLILTEGDSAKALAISGLSVVGRDHYGVFPLRGKMLNVRDAAPSQVSANAEITNIKKILGLSHGKEYTDAKALRYGSVMIMTDQDHDGSHIKGLLINFLHHFWPSLLKIPDFVVEFITPIVKATKGKQAKIFYTMPEYEAWKEELGGTKGWSIKYYKGLGTSTAAEAKEYFADIDHNRKTFVYADHIDDQCIDMAFSKKKVDERKAWLSACKPGTFLDMSVSTIKYQDFINKELILFSLADLQRSIPSMVDGLKPGQRKIIFCAFKRKLRADIKVAQLAGYVSEHSAYHHGEQSLATTIVGLAQNYVGSNNVAPLVPSGQFGTRLQGGKDHASPRYIFTRLSPLARLLMPEADDQLLDFLEEDGQKIEPAWYMPTLPTVLVNGADGIGTGWSTFVPNYNPLDLCANIRRLLRDEPCVPMMPWYRGFEGTIERASGKSKEHGESFVITGKVREIDENTVEITELPLRKWTQDYKEWLGAVTIGAVAEKDQKKGEKPFISEYKEYHTDESVRFVVTLPADKMRECHAMGLEKAFKLSSTLSTTNMHLFDADGHIRRYESPEAVLEEFFQLRLAYYESRKGAMADSLKADLARLDSKVRFILAVVQGDLVIANRKKAELIAELESCGYEKMTKSGKGAKAAPAESTDSSEDGDEASASGAGGLSYDYLLSMPLWCLTMERVATLISERDGKQGELEELMRTTPSQMWETDLDAFEAALEVHEEEQCKLAAAADSHARKARKGAKGKAVKATAADLEYAQRKAPSKMPPRPAAVRGELKLVPSAGAMARPAGSEMSVDTAAASIFERLNIRATGTVAMGKEVKPKVKAEAKPKAESKPKAAAVAKGKGTARVVDLEEEEFESDAEDTDDDELFGGGSLMARLAARNKKASSSAPAPMDESPPAPAPKPRAAPRRAAAKKAVVEEYELSDSESEGEAEASDASDFEDEFEMPQAKVAVKPKAAPKPKAKAAPKAKPAASAGSKRAASSKGTAKAMDVQEEVTSPANAPDKKVRRMRPSPFHKGSAPRVGEDEDEDEDDGEEAPAPKARAPRRAAAKKAVVEIELDSDEEEDDDYVADDDSGSDSDFDC